MTHGRFKSTGATPVEDQGRRVKVAVIGGGVTGMTAAHELAERGFQVTLYEQSQKTVEPDASHVLSLGGLAASQYFKTPERSSLLGSDWIPGEHGFRLFPSFYRHVFDSMKRTPTEHGKTVFDNVVPTYRATFAIPDKHPQTMYRMPGVSAKMTSFSFDAFRALGGTPSDLVGFATRMIRYLCTCPERRAAECESQTFLEYIEGARDPVGERYEYSEAFLASMEFAPRVLVAFSASDGDARTTMSVAVQMAVDTVELREKTDGTLVGPTSETWFDPWRKHLEDTLCVDFVNRKVTGFDEAAPRSPLGPHIVEGITVVASEPDGGGRALQTFDYVIIATDSVQAEELGRELWKSQGQDPSRSPLDGYTSRFSERVRSAELRGKERDPQLLVGSRDPSDAATYGMGLDERDRLQTMTSIQFYFAGRLSLDVGHMFYADSPWGLSSICEQEFWPPARTTTQAGAYSVLSVDITRLDAEFEGKTFYDSSPDEAARLCWAQIKRCLSKFDMPEPEYFHIDDGIVYGPEGAAPDELRPVRNRGPYLVPIVDDWESRPGGDPWCPIYGRESQKVTDKRPDRSRQMQEQSGWCADHGGYWVHFDRALFAGSYARTFTRLTTMEASSESARHAVNALIDHITRSPSAKAERLRELLSVERASELEEGTHEHARALYRRPSKLGDYAGVWNMEELEPDSFEPLKKLDAQLFAEGKPHVFDLLGLEAFQKSQTRWPIPSSLEDLASKLDLAYVIHRWARVDEALLTALSDVGKLWQRLALGSSAVAASDTPPRSAAPPMPDLSEALDACASTFQRFSKVLEELGTSARRRG